jgi:DNA invertase Pin-like site-specific DNA recombinase
MDLVAYIRVSTQTQVDGFGLDMQERAVRKWAKANGHKVVAVCKDAGVSGTKEAVNRPGLSDALDMLRPPPRAMGIVVARLDRLARALTVQEAILQIAWRAGATVFTAEQGEVLEDDPDDPMRKAMRTMAGVFAELDREQINKRMRDGRKAKAATGRHSVGAYAFGYHGDGVGRDRDAAPLSDEQETVQRIVELRRAGRSYREIASTLDAEGLRPRIAPTWSAMSVRNIATREMSASK